MVAQNASWTMSASLRLSNCFESQLTTFRNSISPPAKKGKGRAQATTEGLPHNWRSLVRAPYVAMTTKGSQQLVTVYGSPSSTESIAVKPFAKVALSPMSTSAPSSSTETSHAPSGSLVACVLKEREESLELAGGFTDADVTVLKEDVILLASYRRPVRSYIKIVYHLQLTPTYKLARVIDVDAPVKPVSKSLKARKPAVAPVKHEAARKPALTPVKSEPRQAQISPLPSLKGSRKARGIATLPLFMQETVNLLVVTFVIDRMGTLENPWFINRRNAFGVALQDAVDCAYPAEHHVVKNADAVWVYVRLHSMSACSLIR